MNSNFVWWNWHHIPGACVAQIARENGVNDNVIFKWLRLWQNEGRVSRRLPVTTSSDTGVELLPVEITPDEQKEPVAAGHLRYQYWLNGYIRQSVYAYRYVISEK